MKTIALLTGLLSVSMSYGQITLTVDDFSDGGDAVGISTALEPGIDFATTGPNTTWDYAGLTATDQEYRAYSDLSNVSTFVNFMFGTFASADYSATNFISSTALPLDQITQFLPITITDVYQYSKNATDGITSVGFSLDLDGNEIPFKSDTIETRYALPMNYGDACTSSGYTNLDMNPFYNGIWRQHRNRSSSVDGWGTITTPYGTFDALRIHHAIQETDSIFMEVLGTGTWIPLPVPNSHEYEWFTNNELEPLLRITTTEIGGNETVTNVEYLDVYTGPDANVEELSAVISVYPNPVVSELHIDGVTADASYAIFSKDGKLIQDGALSNNELDVSQLPAGNYQILVRSSGEFITNSFIKK